MLNVYVEPPVHLSRAMFRVSAALRRFAPNGVKFVSKAEADFHVLHVISADAIPYAEERPDLKYAVIQYCYQTAGEGQWSTLWDRAKLVWSYYDLPTSNLYMTPLGVDTAFMALQTAPTPRDILAMTSGYVAGPGAEAIEEVMVAADLLGGSVVHLGPVPTRLTRQTSPQWRNIMDVNDSTLAAHYHRTKWVSGLRHVEGFELPALEGLACGARPIMFDRPDARRWFGSHARFVTEATGDQLIVDLLDIMRNEPDPVTAAERTEVLRKFDWAPIVQGFWERVL